MRQGLALALLGAAFAAALTWLAFAQAPGGRKRLLFRAFLLALAAALLGIGRATGVFALVSPGMTLLLGLVVLLVVVGNLVGVRFCDACGRMHRNLRVRACKRCGFALSQHGLTDQRVRVGRDPTDPLGKRRAGSGRRR